MEIRQSDKLPWVIGGDFNVVRFTEERKGRSTIVKTGRISMTSSTMQA